ncbi:hypothetical protein ON010_g11130 [Phytophthora cinnamomi]|nr:hypothetical protein ON010_g11130 [Phytophthora cinnamomi]
MARTKQNAKKSTGGNAPSVQLATMAGRKIASEKTNVTSDGEYVTTVQKWFVAKIVDRRTTPNKGHEYRVFWTNNNRKNRKYQVRTWEPKKFLLEDGFKENIDLIDRWKTSNVRDLESFCVDSEEDQKLIAASTAGRCMFEALKTAAALAGRPDIVTDRDINIFACEALHGFATDIDKGIKWKIFLAFLRQLRDAGRDFIFRAIERDNFGPCGKRGARVLGWIDLNDGIYLVAAYNPEWVGHCFVLKVDGKQRAVYDKGRRLAMDDEKLNWINSFAFIRPFIVFKKK